MSETILVVDDEPRVLNGMKRVLHGLYTVVTAVGGAAGLTELAENDDIAVVVSDMRMPLMDGAEFLSKVRQRYPHVVRMMLTGNNDQETAKKAVNDGAVFRFLNKPCTRDELAEAIDAALDFTRMQRAEQDVLENTLGASVGLMADILAMVKPGHFGSIGRLVSLSTKMAEHVVGVEPWAMHAAATLSQLGYLTIRDELIVKRRQGVELTPEEVAEFRQHTAAGATMIEKIPRMADVANIVRHQESRFADANGSPMAARVLHLAIEYDLLRLSGDSTEDILNELDARDGEFDPNVMDALREVCREEQSSVMLQRVGIEDLEVGMVIAEDIKTDKGLLVVFAGQPVTLAVIGHLKLFQKAGTVDATPLVQTTPAARAADPELELQSEPA